MSSIKAPPPPLTPLSERLNATPRLACEALARAINAKDLQAALGCFSPGGGLIGPDGSISEGEAALRARLGALIAAEARVELKLSGVLVAKDIALAHEHWRISYGDSPDPAAAKAASPTLVLRLHRAEWKVAIAAPWGVPATEPLKAIWP